MMTKENLIVQLTEDRNLGYAEYGDGAGHPVFFFHGFPGSRLQAGDFHQLAKTHRCRLISIDRPGMGLSSFNQQHTLLSWANDITALANHLEIDHFSLLGHSGGAPFVMACAYAMPERITNAAIVSGIAPTTLPESQISQSIGLKAFYFLIRTVPGLALMMMKAQHTLLKLPKNIRDKMYQKMIQQLPSVDQAILQEPGSLNKLYDVSTEAFKQGARGPAHELRLIVNPWGFDLNKIKTPMTLWQGALDKQVPISHAKLYQAHLPNTQLQLFEQEGHLSILYNHMDDILSRLIC